MTFDDAAPGKVIEGDPIPSTLTAPDLGSYKDFFMRPMRIYTVDWTEAGTINTHVQLSSYFSNAVVKEKMHGFSRFRGTLCFKITLNSSPFHFGCLIAAWRPMYNHNSGTNSVTMSGPNLDDISGTAPNVYATAISSFPYHGYCYPAQSEGLTMKIPFFWMREWLTVTGANTLDYKNYGSLAIKSLTPLYVASAATGFTTTVNVFAWWEDVEIGGMTYTAQSGTETVPVPLPSVSYPIPLFKLLRSEDARTNGDFNPDSMTFKLKAAVMIPQSGVVSSYLGTGAKILGTAAKIASAFGFSNDPNLSSKDSAKIVPLQNLASTEVSTTVEPLTLVHNQGLDLRIPGCSPFDELNISYIGAKEAYLDQVSWDTTQVQDTLLACGYGSPEYFLSTSSATAAAATMLRIQMLPMCHLAQMASLWRGNLKLRFKIISSQFHRGRIRFAYDSDGIPPTAGPTDLLNSSRIIDLSEATDFSITLPWTAERPFLKVTGNPQTGSGSILGKGSSPSTTYFQSYHCGGWALYVSNSLMAPISASGVKILIFASMENFELTNPCELTNYKLSYTSPYTTQSGKAIGTADPNDGVIIESIPFPIQTVDYSQYAGEKLVSARALFHRSNFFTELGVHYDLITFNATSPLGLRNYIIPLSRIPLSPGTTCPAGSTLGLLGTVTRGLYYHRATRSANNYTHNFCNQTPLTWLMPCFAAQRGSFVYKLLTRTGHMSVYTSTSANPVITGAKLTRCHYMSTATESIKNYSTSSNARSSILNDFSSSCGAALTGDMGALEVSVPFYSSNKFTTTNARLYSDQQQSVTLAKDYFDTLEDSMELMLSVQTPSNFQVSNYCDLVLPVYLSAGTDFTVGMYLCPPSIYTFDNALIPSSTSW